MATSSKLVSSIHRGVPRGQSIMIMGGSSKSIGKEQDCSLLFLYTVFLLAKNTKLFYASKAQCTNTRPKGYFNGPLYMKLPLAIFCVLYNAHTHTHDGLVFLSDGNSNS